MRHLARTLRLPGAASLALACNDPFASSHACADEMDAVVAELGSPASEERLSVRADEGRVFNEVWTYADGTSVLFVWWADRDSCHVEVTEPES